MTNSGDSPLTYADAGVDIDKADDFVKAVKKIASRTPRSGVMGDYPHTSAFTVIGPAVTVGAYTCSNG